MFFKKHVKPGMGKVDGELVEEGVVATTASSLLLSRVFIIMVVILVIMVMIAVFIFSRFTVPHSLHPYT